VRSRDGNPGRPRVALQQRSPWQIRFYAMGCRRALGLFGKGRRTGDSGGGDGHMHWFGGTNGGHGRSACLRTAVLPTAGESAGSPNHVMRTALR